jgi:hypothetical protein
MADPNNYDVEVELYFHDIDPLWNEMVFEGSVVMGPESTFLGPELLIDQAERMAEYPSKTATPKIQRRKGKLPYLGS